MVALWVLARGIGRSVGVWVCTALVILISFSGSPFAGGRKARLRFRLRVRRFLSRRGLRFMGISLDVRGLERVDFTRPLLLVSNHVSYLDIILLSSLVPAVFVAAVEWRRAPLVGWLSRCGGTVFVHRYTRARLSSEIESVAAALAAGFSAVLFPEGTSSDGQRVHPFKSSLFAAAERAGVDILPLSIRYVSINGCAIDKNNRHLVHFWRPMKFFPHALRVPFLGTVRARVDCLQPIRYGECATRKDLAAECHRRIEQSYLAE